jgi:flagellum-specific peptidoglycan hydrolase FlgJ
MVAALWAAAIGIVSTAFSTTHFDGYKEGNADAIKAIASVQPQGAKKKIEKKVAANELPATRKNVASPTEGVTEIEPVPSLDDGKATTYVVTGSAISGKHNSSKDELCLAYIARFSNIAKAEQRKFKIPASITMAQGLLESDAGKSRLVGKSNNHFGIKTWNKSVSHVVAHDDNPDDMFRTYSNAWLSYRDHSLLLKKENYGSLFKLNPTDYVGWAKGLQSCGYATDKGYAVKLIALIERYKLYNLDK